MLFVLGPMHHIPSFIKSFLFPFSPPPSFYPLLPAPSLHSLLPSLLPTPFSLSSLSFALFFFASSFSFLFPFLPSLILPLFPLHPFFFLHPLYFSPLSLSRPLSLSLHFFSRYTFFCVIMKYWFSVMYIKYQFNVVINIQNHMVIRETVHL